MPSHRPARHRDSPIPPALFFSGRQGRPRDSRSREGPVTQAKVASPTPQEMDDLSEVRQRLLREAELATSHNKASAELRQSYRKRAWEIAFGKPGGDDIEVSTMEFSLYCPYSRTAMKCPVRSESCLHVQCCDLDSWISLFKKQRSMRDRRAACPVCKGGVLASSLEVDAWQLQVLSEMSQGTQKLVLNADGTYYSGDISRKVREEDMVDVLDFTQVSTQEVLTEEGPDTTGGSSSSGTSCSPTFVKSEPTLIKHEPLLTEDPPKLDYTEPSQSYGSASDDDVVVVHYETSARRTRSLPSQLRLWTAHCPVCKQTMLNTGKGGEQHQCNVCGVGRNNWTFVRYFPNSSITLELTGDGTVLIRGVDAMAPYLWRAGFSREVFADSSSSACQRRGTGVWYSSFAFTRYELDFLEVCCERLSRHEKVGDIAETPSIFRIPGKRRAENLSPLSLTASGR